MKMYLCGREETLEEVLKRVNESDPDGRTFTLDQEADRCYIGDERFSNADVLINYRNTYFALNEKKD